MMIRTLIIEDEKPAADRIEKLLKESDQDIEILAKIQSIGSAVEWFRNNAHPDLIILDIQLADGISFEIFRKVKVESFVIFTTAYDEYAIKAFELNSVDYLLKPIDKAKLQQSLQKFYKLSPTKNPFDIQSLVGAIEGLQKNYKKRFLVSIGEKIISIETTEVAFFYSSEKATFLCTHNDRHFPLEYSLDTLENIMNPEEFFRLNRQYLASRRSLEKIYILSKSRIKVELKPPVKESLFVSNARTHDFRLWLDE